MRQLSANGQRRVEDIANRHGFSVEATISMLDSVLRGNGGMAQFSHPEFGGSGQWMRGGMTMVSDMFDGDMKARVDALCSDLADLVATQPELVRAGGFQSQQQGSTAPSIQTQPRGADATGASATAPSSFAAPGDSMFVPMPHEAPDRWWPESLGQPASVGAQNNARYAYFPERRRLALDTASGIAVYDTGSHNIGGFSQQQSSGGSVSFASQHGPVDLASLPVVSDARSATPASVEGGAAGLAPTASSTPSAAMRAGSEIFETIERLGALKEKGLLSEDEFATKKAELLARL